MSSLRRILNQALRPLDLSLCKAGEFNGLKIKLQQSLETSAILYEEQQTLAKTIEQLTAKAEQQDETVYSVSPQWDLEPFIGRPKFYFIAGSARSGSTLLSYSLAQTGLAGAPLSTLTRITSRRGKNALVCLSLSSLLKD